MTRPRPPAERVLARSIEDGNGCWIFQGALKRGYGKVSRGPGQPGWMPAHRATYEFFVGPIPEGLSLDHLCRTLACVNPWHLEPVSIEENTRRGRGWEVSAQQRLARTTCKRGHPYDRVKSDGARGCRTCQREWTRAYKLRRKGQVPA